MLSDDITRYVELHRALGFKFRLQTYLLRHFARFAESRGDCSVRIETVLEWAKTMTWKGLHPVVHRCEKAYAKGVRLGKAAKKKLEERLHRSATLPKWDVRIDNQLLDLGKTWAAFLPPSLQAIGDKVTGLGALAQRQGQFAGFRDQYPAGNHFFFVAKSWSRAARGFWPRAWPPRE